jgi:hypothetical protein
MKEWHNSPAPIGRIGQPSELGPAYVFLASQDGSFISGQRYVIVSQSDVGWFKQPEVYSSADLKEAAGMGAGWHGALSTCGFRADLLASTSTAVLLLLDRCHRAHYGYGRGSCGRGTLYQ